MKLLPNVRNEEAFAMLAAVGGAVVQMTREEAAPVIAQLRKEGYYLGVSGGKDRGKKHSIPLTEVNHKVDLFSSEGSCVCQLSMEDNLIYFDARLYDKILSITNDR